jgi:predicted DNA-binding ribbon-helix-helix protein
MGPQPSQTAELREATETLLRVLQRAGQKSAIKLERIFWSQLKDFARADKTSLSKLVLSVVDQAEATQNRTSLLRCYVLDRLRRRNALPRIEGQSFDLMALIATCPVPVAIVTRERKLSAFNPAFSDLLKTLRGEQFKDRAIQLSFSEPLPKIITALTEQPNTIRNYQLGLQLGEGQARYFSARFALTDRSKGSESLVAIYINVK